MATDLSKLFVAVPTDSVSGFLTKYGPDATGTRDNKYDGKICFLGNTGQIFTQGQLYGGAASDISELQTLLAGLSSTDTDTEKQSVVNAIAAAKAAVLGDADADTTKTQTVGAVSTRVTAIETLLDEVTAGSDDTKIDKLSEILTWFAGVSQDQETYKITVGTEEVELGKGQAGLLSTVAENKLAIGEKGTAAVLYTYDEYKALDGNDAVTEAEFNALSDAAKTKTAGTASTGLYKEIADAVSASNSAIEALDVTDTAVDGKYVSSVSQEDGKITVTRADLPTLSVKTGSEDYVSTDDHEIEIKTTALGDAVGLTKATTGDNAGKWVAADGSVAANPGLATAADVAAEIVADEQVIAAALNDHESRISANETAIGKKAEGENAATGLYKEIEDAKAAANAAHNTITEKTDGHVTVSSTTDATTGAVTYTISENDIASAAILGTASVAASEGVEAKAATGVIAQVEAVEGRLDAIEAWDMWETYTPAQA